MCIRDSPQPAARRDGRVRRQDQRHPHGRDQPPRHPRPRPACLLYTSDAADERSSVDLGGRRIIKKKTTQKLHEYNTYPNHNNYHNSPRIQK